MIDTIRDPAEAYNLRLRALFEAQGYQKYKMSRFGEYELYSRNRGFLISDRVITFNDTDGSLLALKPDVTLSLVNSLEDRPEEVRKLCYTESVFRVSGRTGRFQELTQTGLECIGRIDEALLTEVIRLAAESLRLTGLPYRIELSHLQLLSACIRKITDDPLLQDRLRKCVNEKNRDGIRKVLKEEGLPEEKASALFRLLDIRGNGPEAREQLTVLSAELDLRECGETLGGLLALADEISLNFSLTDDMSYYSGIIFKGFAESVPDAVLSGGSYDGLMQKMGRRSQAVGFAVYLDALISAGAFTFGEGAQANEDRRVLNIALPKGRLGDRVAALFEKAGYKGAVPDGDSRKLILESDSSDVRFLLVKPADVAIYVERGAADVGVVGSDILEEDEPDVYDLLDLRTGLCRMAIAAPEGRELPEDRPLRVATKYIHAAGKYFRTKGQAPDLIRLSGSIELAPLLGLSDVIFDIVETGTTLRENHLQVIEEAFPVSARLIACKASYAFLMQELEAMRNRLAEVIS